MTRSLWIIAFAVSVVGCASHPDKRTAHALGIAGIRLEDSEKTVTARLGRPPRTSHLEDYIHTRYEYPGLSVGFAMDSVGEIESTDPRYCTEQGLCPGDSLATMRRLYGEPQTVNREEGPLLEYITPDCTCWYQFSAKAEKIEMVRIVCQP